MRAIVILAAITTHAFADPPRLVVNQVDVEEHGKYGIHLRRDWRPVLDDVEISRGRFYSLVGRPDLARAVRDRRVLGGLVIALGIATVVFGSYEHRYPAIAIPAIPLGGLGIVTGIGIESEADAISPSVAKHLLEVARF